MKLPSLRQLRIEGPGNHCILTVNAEHLEMLSINLDGSSWNKSPLDLPTSLPHLSMLIVEYMNENVPIINRLLQASVESLTHLVLSNSTENNNYSFTAPAILMENLTHLAYDFVSQWTNAFIQSNAFTLEFIAIGMEYNFYDTPVLDCDMPNLEDIVFTFDEVEFVTGMSFFKHTVFDRHPGVNIRTEKGYRFSDVANAFIKKHGGDKILNVEESY